MVGANISLKSVRVWVLLLASELAGRQVTLLLYSRASATAACTDNTQRPAVLLGGADRLRALQICMEDRDEFLKGGDSFLAWPNSTNGPHPSWLTTVSISLHYFGGSPNLELCCIKLAYMLYDPIIGNKEPSFFDKIYMVKLMRDWGFGTPEIDNVLSPYVGENQCQKIREASTAAFAGQFPAAEHYEHYYTEKFVPGTNSEFFSADRHNEDICRNARQTMHESKHLKEPVDENFGDTIFVVLAIKYQAFNVEGDVDIARCPIAERGGTLWQICEQYTALLERVLGTVMVAAHSTKFNEVLGLDGSGVLSAYKLAMATINKLLTSHAFLPDNVVNGQVYSHQPTEEVVWQTVAKTVSTLTNRPLKASAVKDCLFKAQELMLSDAQGAQPRDTPNDRRASGVNDGLWSGGGSDQPESSAAAVTGNDISSDDLHQASPRQERSNKRAKVAYASGGGGAGSEAAHIELSSPPHRSTLSRVSPRSEQAIKRSKLTPMRRGGGAGADRTFFELGYSSPRNGSTPDGVTPPGRRGSAQWTNALRRAGGGAGSGGAPVDLGSSSSRHDLTPDDVSRHESRSSASTPDDVSRREGRLNQRTMRALMRAGGEAESGGAPFEVGSPSPTHRQTLNGALPLAAQPSEPAGDALKRAGGGAGSGGGSVELGFSSPRHDSTRDDVSRPEGQPSARAMRALKRAGGGAGSEKAPIDMVSPSPRQRSTPDGATPQAAQPSAHATDAQRRDGGGAGSGGGPVELGSSSSRHDSTPDGVFSREGRDNARVVHALKRTGGGAGSEEAPIDVVSPPPRHGSTPDDVSPQAAQPSAHATDAQRRDGEGAGSEKAPIELVSP